MELRKALPFDVLELDIYKMKGVDGQSTMKNKTILCAIDFSESSADAMHWAIQMAQLTDEQVVFLFCYRLIGAGNEDGTLDLKRNIENDAVRKYNEMQKILVRDQDVSCKFISEVGFFPFRIENFIRNGAVNMLVLGNSIIDNFDEYKNLNFDMFLKSTKIPVVVVPVVSREPVKLSRSSSSL